MATQKALFDDIEIKTNTPWESELQAERRHDLSDAERLALVLATAFYHMVMDAAEAKARKDRADRITRDHICAATADLLPCPAPCWQGIVDHII